MKHAFINADGILTAWGFVESNGEDQKVEVPEDFHLEPGKWRLEGGNWVAVAA